MQTQLSAEPSLSFSSSSPGVVVLIDAENIDGVLAGILAGSSRSRRRPRSEERPRWNRVTEFVAQMYPDRTDPVSAHMFLVDRQNAGFHSFVDVLPDLGVEPVILNPESKVPVVDKAILATINYLGESSHDDLIVLSHDGVYMEALEPLLSADRRVAIIGFPEFLSHRYRQHEIETYDLELDVNAFDFPLPRATKTAIDLSAFDPKSLFPRRLM